MKTLLSIALLVSLSLVLNGCATQPTISEVPFNKLVSEPELYNGETVTTTGIYISGWEWNILAEDIEFSGSGDFRTLKVVGQAIHFNGVLQEEDFDKLYQNNSLGAGRQYFGKVKVTGSFEYGERYGHMGGGSYQITPSKIELLDWIPSE